MPAEHSGIILNISAVERETGLSKDVLRMWERRYGFPKPGRDDNGERQYSRLRDREAARDQAPDGRRDAARQDHPATLDALNALADARIAPRATRSHPASSATFSRCCAPMTRPAAEFARESADEAGTAALRAGDDDAAQPRGRRRVDARRAARSSRSTSTPSSCRSRCARRSMRFRARRARRACC